MSGWLWKGLEQHFVGRVATLTRRQDDESQKCEFCERAVKCVLLYL